MSGDNDHLLAERESYLAPGSCPPSATSAQKAKSYEHYEVMESCGSGSYGEVYRVIRLTDGVEVAIKRFNSKFGSRSDPTQTIKAEREVFLALRKKPHIVQFYHELKDKYSSYFFMEYCGSGDLTTLVKTYGTISPMMVHQILVSILHSLNALHSSNYFHRDIKPANVMVGTNGVIKLTDFGTTKKISSAVKVSTRTRQPSIAGTTYFIPPEVLESVSEGAMGDIYALGVLLCYIISGDVPTRCLSTFNSKTNNQASKDEMFYVSNANVMNAVSSKVHAGNKSYGVSSEVLSYVMGMKCNEDCKDFILRCLERDPEKRIGAKSFDELYAHPYVSNYVYKSDISIIGLNADVGLYNIFKNDGLEWHNKKISNRRLYDVYLTETRDELLCSILENIKNKQAKKPPLPQTATEETSEEDKAKNASDGKDDESHAECENKGQKKADSSCNSNINVAVRSTFPTERLQVHPKPVMMRTQLIPYKLNSLAFTDTYRLIIGKNGNLQSVSLDDLSYGMNDIIHKRDIETIERVSKREIHIVTKGRVIRIRVPLESGQTETEINEWVRILQEQWMGEGEIIPTFTKVFASSNSDNNENNSAIHPRPRISYISSFNKNLPTTGAISNRSSDDVFIRRFMRPPPFRLPMSQSECDLVNAEYEEDRGWCNCMNTWNAVHNKRNIRHLLKQMVSYDPYLVVEKEAAILLLQPSSKKGDRTYSDLENNKIYKSVRSKYSLDEVCVTTDRRHDQLINKEQNYKILSEPHVKKYSFVVDIPYDQMEERPSHMGIQGRTASMIYGPSSNSSTGSLSSNYHQWRSPRSIQADRPVFGSHEWDRIITKCGVQVRLK